MNDKTKDLTKSEGVAEDIVPQTTPASTPAPDPDSDSSSSDNLNTDLDSDNAQYIASIADEKEDEVEATAPTDTSPTPATDDTSADTLSSPSANASLSASTGLGSTNTTPPKIDKPAKKKTEIKLDAASLRTAASAVVKQLLRYAPILFFLLVAIVYGFVVLRINTLSNAQPSQSDIDAQTTTTPIPRIDPNTAKRLENLEDNSQNVQTLFDEARKNPFD